jgi:hypothetical protein
MEIYKASELSKQLLNDVIKVKEEYNRYYGNVHITDLQICDLLHQIEFDTFNAAEGYCLAKKLQEARRQRRQLKDEVNASYSILKFIETLHLQEKLEQTNNTVDNIVKGYIKRKYRLRFDPNTMQGIR